MKKKNIKMCIFLSVITFGIYSLFWAVDLIFDTDRYYKEKTSIPLKIFYSFITGGLYLVYWAYKTGKVLSTKSKEISDKSKLYIFLMLIPIIISMYVVANIDLKNNLLDIVNAYNLLSVVLLFTLMSLIQKDLNKLIDLKILK